MIDLLDLPPNAEKRLKPASFLMRLGAALADAIILLVAQWILAQFLRGLGMYEFYVLLILITLFYYLGMETASVRGTIGKVIFRLRVSRKNGERMHAGTALMRLLAKIVSAIPFGVGFFIMLGDEQKRTLHDRITGTMVHEG